jgi:tetratricopeptide (TPR) repeat protein
LQELAEAHAVAPDLARHIAVCQRVIPLARELGDGEAEAESLFAIGTAQVRLGDHEAALSPLREALAMFEALDRPERVLACRQSLGGALVAGGEVAAGAEEFRRVAAAEGWSNRWKGLLSLGAVAEWRGNYRDALAHLDEADEVIGKGADPSAIQVAETYLNANRVNVFLGCGDYQNALSLAEACFAEAEASGNADQYVESQLNIGACLAALGRWTEAAEWLGRAQQVARMMGDRTRENMAGSCLAEAFTEMGRYEPAKVLARDAVTAAIASKSTRCLIAAHRALGTVYARMRGLDEAAYHLEQAAEHAAAANMMGAHLWCQVRLAEARFYADETQDARAMAEQAVSAAQELGAEHAEAEARLSTAHCALHLGDAGSASASARAAVSMADSLGLPDLRARAGHAAAEVAVAEGDSAGAEKHWRAAIARLSALRKQFVGDSPDTTLEDERRAAIYGGYVELLLRLNRKEDAERIVHRADWPPLAQHLEAR